MACNFLSLNKGNNEFVLFLCSDTGQNIMTNNSLSIHIESGDIFYDNWNTNENFYSFLLAQQDESNQPIPKRISYHHSFDKCIKNYLPSFSIDEAEKQVLLLNNNSKYLLCRFNDWIELLGEEKPLIRPSSKAKDSVGLKKIEEKDRQFLIEKTICNVEKENPYAKDIEKSQKLCSRLKQTTESAGTFISRCL